MPNVRATQQSRNNTLSRHAIKTRTKENHGKAGGKLGVLFLVLIDDSM